MSRRGPVLAGLLAAAMIVFVANPQAYAQQASFKKVKARSNRSERDRRLVDKDADLVFDDGKRRLTVKCADFPLDIPYDSIDKIVFDVTTHMRGGAMSQVIGGVAGAMVAAEHVSDYWLHLTYKTSSGEMKTYLLEIDRDASKTVIEKAQTTFGDKVMIATFAEKSDKVEKDTLKDLQSKHDMKIDKKTHPIPGIQPEKALVVVVCPPIAARYSGKGNQFKLHANDRVIAVNKMGSYSFAYLDPGDYRLVSQSENANGLQITLEAGKDYYFLQDTFMGAFKARTALSQHAKELVLYEMSGAGYSDWKRKK